MTTFPSITGNRLIRALRKFGFEVIRVKSSHHFLQHQDGRSTVVPQHRGESIGRGLLAQILRDCDITREELEIQKITHR
jgi:predicted RNA binding protein YcfA (HicA-like mRNA interferase family)